MVTGMLYTLLRDVTYLVAGVAQLDHLAAVILKVQKHLSPQACVCSQGGYACMCWIR
jgi:hypothetical protein